MTPDGYRTIAANDATGLGSVLPHDIVAVEAYGDAPPEPLFPDETTYVAHAIERRRMEFARGRTCARLALAAFGRPRAAIVAGPDRAPVWPAGIVGSISHCRDYTCAAVGEARAYRALGIDAEVMQELEPGVAKLVVSPAEARSLASLPGGVSWSCVAFSAKEAFYKAQYALTRTFLDFLDVAVAIDASAGQFTITLLRTEAVLAPVPPAVAGRYVLDGERVVSAVAIT